MADSRPMLGRLALAWFRLSGWRIEGALPPLPRQVIIGAPHTSNWDFVLMLAAFAKLELEASFMAKHTLFRWPVGSLLRRLGGIPIRRHLRASAVEQMAAAFEAAEALILIMTPEGTRSSAPRWRSGFYHIARAAGVPLVLAGLDYPGKRLVIGPAMTVTGDIRADMDRIREFYVGLEGRWPGNASVIRLEEEGEVG